jgi:sulfur relay (sulfurtransferase) DsrC/TusE family protein
MKIKYLKKMEKTPDIEGHLNEGITEEQIHEIESKTGYHFPVSYKEFLYLGGNSSSMLANMNHDCYFDEEVIWQERQQIAKEQAEEDGIKIDRDYWVFADYGREQWHFFYFDEGDNPPVYFYCSYFDDEQGNEYPGIERLNDSFSEYIEEAIEDKKKNGY